MNGPNKTLRAVVLGLGYFFLYVPIISLMVFSFNESPAVTSPMGQTTTSREWRRRRCACCSPVF